MSEPTGEHIAPPAPKNEPIASQKPIHKDPIISKGADVSRSERKIILSNNDRIESVKLQLELLGMELTQLKKGGPEAAQHIAQTEHQIQKEFEELQKRLINEPDDTTDPWLSMLIQHPLQGVAYAEIIPKALETTERLRAIDRALKTEQGGAHALLQLKGKLACGTYSGIEVVSTDHNALVIRFLSPTGNHFIFEQSDGLSFEEAEVSQLSLSPNALPRPVIKPDDFNLELEAYRNREEEQMVVDEENRLRDVAKAREEDIPSLMEKFKEDVGKKRPMGDAREDELTRIDSLLVVGDAAIIDHLRRFQEAIETRRVNPPSARFSDTEQFLARSFYLVRRAGIKTSDPLSAEVQRDLDKLEAQIEIEREVDQVTSKWAEEEHAGAEQILQQAVGGDPTIQGLMAKLASFDKKTSK